MAIGPILRTLLDERDLNPYRLAALSGVNANHIGLMLSGKIANPRGDTLAKLAAALGVHVEALLGDSSSVAESSPPFSAGSDHDAARPSTPSRSRSVPSHPEDRRSSRRISARRTRCSITSTGRIAT